MTGSMSPGILQAPSAGRAPGSERWLVFVLTAVAMLASIDRQILSLLINPIKADLGLTDTEISLVIGAAFALAHIAFTLPAGYFADAKSPRLLIVWGGWFWSIMTIGCGTANSFVQMFVMRAGVGAGEAAVNPGALAILRSAVPPERRGRAFSTYYMSLMIGAALALLVGGLLVGAIERNQEVLRPLFGEVSPWRAALFIVGAIGIPVTALMFTIKLPRSRTGPQSEDTGTTSYRAALRFVRANWQLFLPLWSSNTVFMLVTAAFAAWLAALTQRTFGMSAEKTGIVLGSAMLVMPQIGLLVAGRFIDRLSVRSGLVGVAKVGAIGTLGFWIGTTLVPQIQLQVVYFAVLAFSYMFSQAPMPAYATLLSGITPAHLMGKITSIQLILQGLLGIAIGPTLVAVVSDTVFPGPQGIASALSLVAFSVGWIPAASLMVLGRKLKENPSSFAAA